MIIHKETGSVETRDGFPNQNFGDYENVFIVNDASELGVKVASMGYSVDLVLDAEGNLIDVAARERPLEPPTEIKILRLEQAQSNAEMIDLMMAMLGGV